MGSKRYKNAQWREFANFEEQDTLTDGQKVDRPYRSNVVVENYTPGTALSAQDLTATSDEMTVDTVKALLMYIDNVDKIQNKYNVAESYIAEAMRRLNLALDARFWYEVFNAADTIDDGDISGTNGNPITLSTVNVYDVLTALNLKFDANNVPLDQRKLACSPQFKAILKKKLEGKNSEFGDKVGAAGFIGEYDGIKFYQTNNLTASARWTPADRPSDGDTVTINGVTFTFETGTLDAAGKVKSETDLETTLAHLAAFINAGGANADTDGYALSAANQRTVQMWVAVPTATYIDIRVMGASFLTVSASDANDVWSLKTQHMLASAEKAIDAVVQKNPSVEMASTVSAGKSGMNILPMTIAGFHTFNQGTLEIFDVQIDTANTAGF